MRVLVCGGRDYTDQRAVWDALDALHAKNPITLMIEGGATGADTLGYEWAVARGVLGVTFQADWKKYGRAAGPIRNTLMLTEGKPDLVIAFPGGRGTANMIEQAKQAGVVVLTPTPPAPGGGSEEGGNE